MEDNPLDRLSKEDRKAYEEFKARGTLISSKWHPRKEEVLISGRKESSALSPTYNIQPD